MSYLVLIALVVGCYLIGSFPTAYLVGRLNRINIFEFGSGNMGTANTLRALGPAWAFIVWLIDVSKGIGAVLLARMLAPFDQVAAGIIGAIAVVIGHNWSVMVLLIMGRLRGGKGAATAGGTWLLLAPLPVFAITVGLWGMLALGTRYSSLAVLIAFCVGTVWMMGLIAARLIDPLYSIYTLSISAMVYFRHADNIRALLAGRERRLGEQTR